MKTKLSAGLTALQGKIGALCGKVIRGRQQVGRLSIPYGISQEAPSAQQLLVRLSYGLAVQQWRTATQEQRDEWTALGAPLGISGFNYILLVSMIDQTSVNPDLVESTELTTPIATLEDNLNRIRHWIIALSGEAWGTVTTSTAALLAKFHATTGHKHTGAASDGPVLDHGLLDGLGDDDHTEYTLADGSRAFSGDQSMGTHKLTSLGDPAAAQDAATQNFVNAIGKAWATWSPVYTWATATPTGITTWARWTQSGRVLFFEWAVSCTDSKGTTGLTLTLPAIKSAEGCASVYAGISRYGVALGTINTNGAGLAVNSTNLIFFVFRNGTNGQPLQMTLSGFYETD